MPRYTIFSTPVITPLISTICATALKLLGWQIKGINAADTPRCIIIGVPHTTNWDLPFSLMIAFQLKVPLFWMGKDSIFKFPFGGLMRWMGSIPVDRSRSHNTVTTTAQLFETDAPLRILMAPEGTRSEVKVWKSGFYHIAVQGNVPILLGYIDYKRKMGGIAQAFYPTGDYDADLQQIQGIYARLTQ